MSAHIPHAIIETVSQIGKDDPRALDWLKEIAKDFIDSEVRGEAVYQIASNWSNIPGTQEFLKNISLNDPDEQLREWAQEQLEKLEAQNANFKEEEV